MSLYEEAWEKFQRDIARSNAGASYNAREILNLMNAYLRNARQKAKEYQKKLAKELEREAKKYVL